MRGQWRGEAPAQRIKNWEKTGLKSMRKQVLLFPRIQGSFTRSLLTHFCPLENVSAQSRELKEATVGSLSPRKRRGTGDGACNYGNRRQRSFLKDVSNGITAWRQVREQWRSGMRGGSACATHKNWEKTGFAISSLSGTLHKAIFGTFLPPGKPF